MPSISIVALTFLLFCQPLRLAAQLTSRIDCYLPQTKDSTECKLIVKRLDQELLISSTMVLDEHALFVVTLAEPCPAYIWVENRKADVPLFVDAADIRLVLDSSAKSPPQITGSFTTGLWIQQDSLLTQLQESHTEARSALSDRLLASGLRSEWAQRLNHQHDSLQAHYVTLLTKLIQAHPQAQSSWYVYASHFSTLPYSTVVELFAQLAAFASYPSRKAIQRKLAVNQVGQQAADFVLPTLTQNQLRLSDVAGKYILLDFSSSYLLSSASRYEALRGLYTRYHSLGLEVVTVTREFDLQTATTNLSAKGLPWPVAIDIEGPSSGWVAYRLDPMPTTLLLNKRKKIIARDSSLVSLEEQLRRLLMD